MQSVMSHSFSRVPKANIQRSQFNRSSGYKTTFDAGYLVPVFLDEALPGDTFNLKMHTFARLATPIVPIMDNMYLESFFFAVPYRLVWDNWEKFNGQQDKPTDSTDYLIPNMTSPAGGYANGSLSDYYGIPTKVAGLEHSSLWHRAYNLVYNEWFRDQNLQDSVHLDTGDGPDNPSNYVLLRRGKRHDYFTACLPFPQKGDAVKIPLGTKAPVATDGSPGVFVTVESTAQDSAVALTGNTSQVQVGGDKPDGNNSLYADLSQATAATINLLREAFQIQKMYEKDARGGTRYTEIIRSHFNVTSDDARLQRPEYLGGGKSHVNISPIAQTGPTFADASVATTPQGNLAAMGVVSGANHGFTKSFTEHTLLIGLVNVRADLTYQQGLNRMFTRSTRFDFYWPTLAHLGEQAVLNKEIYADGSNEDQKVFGYQERYAEYRYKPSLITGKFRSNDTGSLDVWHLSQDFSSKPLLNASFIEDNPPIDRVIATANEPHFLFDAFFDLKCARPMPTYSVPGLIDHF